MSTRTANNTSVPTTSDTPHESARRIASLARGEALLLRRNPMALANAFGAPVIAVLVITSSGVADGAGRAGAAAALLAGLASFALLLGVYYNLVTALAARRQELVLKRLRIGESSDAEIPCGVAAPALALTWAQILLGSLAGIFVLGAGTPTNVVLVLVAVVLGSAVFTLLAAASTALTPTAELAQVTTAPILLVSMILSGTMLPLSFLPVPLQQVAHVLPMTPVVELLHLGLGRPEVRS